MESGVKVEIHHGGQFTTKNGIRYYKGGKTEYIYDQAVDNISVAMCEKFISADLGYKNFKIYWLKDGSSFDSNGCRLLWNDEIIHEMCADALINGRINIYVDHACEESDKIEADNHSDADDSEYDECESEESENESIDIEDEYDTDHDEEFVDIIKKKKEVYQAKKNPMEVAYEEKLKKKVEASQLNDETGWESEYESDSFKLNEPESTDSSDLEVESSRRVEKNKSKSKGFTTFNPNTLMKHIEFEIGLVFTSAFVLKNAIIDYAVEQKRDIWFSKNDLQRVQAKCQVLCQAYIC